MPLPLEKKVCSVDLARRLKALGVEQEIEECCAYYDRRNRLFGWSEGEDKPYFDYAKAHSVAELGEMLPAGIVRVIPSQPQRNLPFVTGTK